MTILSGTNRRRTSIAPLLLATGICCALAPLGGVLAGPAAFVSETRVAAPRRVESLLWTETKYDPARPLSGAVLRYRDEAAPDATITILVHPAGDQSPATALREEFRALLERLENGARNAGNIGYAVDDKSGFSVKLPPRPARSMTVRIGPAGESNPPANPKPAPADRKLYPQKPLRGERVTVTYTVPALTGGEAKPETKHVFLFNRHMHFIRATVTFSGARPSRDQKKAADRIVADIVSRIGIENIGGCGATSTYFPGTDESRLTVGQVLAAIDDVDWRGCVSEASFATIGTNDENTEIVSIAYDANHWSTP